MAVAPVLTSSTPVFVHPIYRKMTYTDKLGQKREYMVHYDMGYITTGTPSPISTGVEGSFYVGSLDQILAVIHTLNDADESNPQTSYDVTQQIQYIYDPENEVPAHRQFNGIGSDTFDDPAANWGSTGLLHWKAPTREI